MNTIKPGLTIIAILLAFLCFQAKADDYAVWDIATHHYGSCVRQKCEQPRRGGWERTALFGEDSLSLQTILGTNSYGRFGVTGTVAFEPIHLGNFRAGALAGISTGYKTDENKLEPLIAALTASYTVKAATFRVAYIPRVNTNTIGVVEAYFGLGF